MLIPGTHGEFEKEQEELHSEVGQAEEMLIVNTPVVFFLRFMILYTFQPHFSYFFLLNVLFYVIACSQYDIRNAWYHLTPRT